MREKIKNIIEKIIPGDWGKEDTDNTGIKIIRTTNFTNIGKIDFSNIVTRIIADKKIKERKLNKGDIIIEKSGGSPNQPVGRVVYFDEEIEEPILCNNFTSIIRCKANVNSKYVFHCLYSNWNKGNTKKYQNKTTGIANLKLEKYLDDLEIELPSLTEQNHIISILDKADEIRQKKKQANDKLDEFLKSTFIDMFGDPVKNEKSFNCMPFVDICLNIFGGGTPSKSHPEYYIGNILWVTPKDMKTLIVSSSIDHINENAVENSSVKLIPANSILMVIRSGILKHTLPVAINKVNVTVNQDMKAFVLNNKIANPFYILYQIKLIEKMILKNVRSVTADNIEFNLIKNLKLVIPPIELQNKFAQIVEKAEQQKQTNEKVIEQMNNLFNSLSQKAFKGEL